MSLQNVLDKLKENINQQQENEYSCKLCNDKEFLTFEDKNGYLSAQKCECLKKKHAYEMMIISGLGNVMDNCTFDKYIVNNNYQKSIKTKAIEFTKQIHTKGFFIGGQVGVGKTHICTAICKHFLDAGVSVRYYMYRDMIAELKGNAIDFEAYRKILNQINNATVLYIDDLFKTKSSNTDILRTDIEHLFTIINNRYVNKKVTIISSEKTLDEIIQIDEAIGSRIKQMCIGEHEEFNLNISKDSSKNYRLKNLV